MFNQIINEEVRVIMEMVNLNYFLNDKFKIIVKDSYFQNFEYVFVNFEYRVITNLIFCLYLLKYIDIL